MKHYIVGCIHYPEIQDPFRKPEIISLLWLIKKIKSPNP